MIKHVVLLHWKAPVDDATINDVNKAFAQLPGQIPEIKSYSFGPDADLYSGNADYALIAEFDNAEDLKHYVSHPAHLKLLKEVTGPILESFSSVQFEIG